MMKNYFPFITFIFILHLTAIRSVGQTQIYGTVVSATGKSLEGTNVLLLNKTDSILVKGTIAGANGSFNFDNIQSGSYVIEASFNGYKTFYTDPLLVGKEPLNVGEIKLMQEGKLLSDVTVTARKPMFEQKIDRMVINVKNSITSAGGTALEVLEKSPGVIVNRQSNSIGLNGKDGVVVMINGKISRMSQDALLQMLSAMNASNIDRIELITTPPANFDAEGNAGYINIILLSNPNKGLNGSFSTSIGYGKGYTTGSSINFNYRNKKINLFGDYSFSWNNQQQIFSFFRSYIHEGVKTDNDTRSMRYPKEADHNARIGIDVQLTPKTVIGALISGYDTKWEMEANNSLRILKNNVLDSSVTVLNHELNQWKHLMGNINFSHTIKEGEVITADLDYLYYKDNNPNDYDNKFYNSADVLLSEEQTKSGKITPLSFWVGKIDYTKKINAKINLEAGGKFALSKFSNSVSVENGGPNWVKDPELTADYKLKENISALYSSLSIEASKKTSVKFGLRYEYTVSNLGSNTQQNIVDRKYGKLFPSVYLSQKLNEKNSINVSYSRRITRPTFNDMAPFVIFMDPYTFFSGNSALQPAFSNIFKADYLYKSFVFSISYTKEDGSIANFQPKLSKDNKQIYTSENLDNSKTANISISLPFTITKWWNMQNNVQANWQEINATYNNGPLKVQQKNFNFNSSQNFTLPKNFSAELSGFYYSKYLYGSAVSKSFGMMDFGLQKKFGKNNNKLRFAISDIFNGGMWRAITNIPAENIYVDYNLRFGYRTFKLTYSQSFGNKKLNANRNRNSASDEEQHRMNR